MTRLFRIVSDASTPAPVFATEPDGTPRVADGVTFFDAAGASVITGQSVEALDALWRATIMDQVVLDDREVVVDVNTGEAKPLEFEDLSDEEIVTRARRRHRGVNDADQWAAFVVMARAMNYSVDARECYPGISTNEETGEQETVCVAKIEALQRRVLASGFYNGMEGPFFRARGGEWMRSWDSDEEPFEGRVLMYRKGVDRPHEAIGKFDHYAGPKREIGGVLCRPRFWRERPLFMLSKCLEAESLRKLFRDVVGNVYIPEEINDRGPSPSRNASRGGGILAEPVGPKAVEYAADADIGTGTPDETVHTEAACRRAMTSCGTPETFQDRLVAEARRMNPLGEDDSPDTFWGEVLGKAQASRSRKVRPPEPMPFFGPR